MLNYVFSLSSRLASTSRLPGLAIAGTYGEYRQFADWLAQHSGGGFENAQAKSYFDMLEQDGIAVVEGYWSEKKCADARAEVDRLIEEYPSFLHGNAKADKRLYGANNVSDVIAEFADDPVLRETASAYNREPTRTAFTLAARMPYSEGNKGSGEGWHRDAFFRQFKAILYLTDVGEMNGPFQFISGSHRADQVVKDMWEGRLGYKQYRLQDSQVDRILKRSPERLNTMTAKAGTMLLIDTSSIHRGVPIKAGERYALTNYCFPERHIDNSMMEKFNVLPKDAAKLAS